MTTDASGTFPLTRHDRDGWYEFVAGADGYSVRKRILYLTAEAGEPGLELPASLALRGTVTDADGRPVPAARVAASAWYASRPPTFGHEVVESDGEVTHFETTTGVDGSFVVSGLDPALEYGLFAMKTGLGSALVPAVSAETARSVRMTRPAELVLERGPGMNGNLSAHFARSNSGSTPSVPGELEFRNLIPGTDLLTVFVDHRFLWTKTITLVSGERAVVRVDGRPEHIRGVLVGADGVPMPGIALETCLNSTGDSGVRRVIGHSKTGADGEFQIDCAAGQRVDLYAAETPSARKGTEFAFRVLGRRTLARDCAAGELPGPLVLAGTRFTVRALPFAATRSTRIQLNAVDVGGRPGGLELRLRPEDDQTLLESEEFATDFDAAAYLTTSSGVWWSGTTKADAVEVRAIDAAALQRKSIVVVTPGGERIPGATIYIHPRGAGTAARLDPEEAFAIGTTDDEGTCNVDAVPLGDPTVFAVAPGFAPGFALGAALTAARTSEPAQIRLEIGGIARFRVTDPASGPVESRIVVERLAEPRLVLKVPLDESGRGTLLAASGEYRARGSGVLPTTFRVVDREFVDVELQSR